MWRCATWRPPEPEELVWNKQTENMTDKTLLLINTCVVYMKTWAEAVYDKYLNTFSDSANLEQMFRVCLKK